MPIPDADPAAVELDAAFKEAMEAPAKPREVAPPPEVDADAPFGRDESGAAKAPYGHTKDGRVRRAAGGRRPKDEAPRTGPVEKDTALRGKVTKKPSAPLPARDYTGALTEFADAIWLGLTGISMVGPKLPVVGKYLPEDKLAAEAAIFNAHKESLAGAVNLAAQHNAGAARFAAKLADGEVTWVAMCGFMCMPFLLHTSAVFRGDEASEAMIGANLSDLAKANQAAMEQFMQKMAKHAEDANEAARSQLQQQTGEGTAA